MTLWCFSTQKYSGMEVPFYNIAGIILVLWWVFQILLISFKYFQCFPVPETKFWAGFEGFFSGQSADGTLSHISRYCIGYSYILITFGDSINFLQRLLIFSSFRDQIPVVWWYWRILLKTARFRTFEYSKSKDTFLIIAGVILIFW